MQNKLSKYVTGFRKSHGTQHSLMIMLEKWKNVLDKGEYVCVLFMDLSKAFDTINHDLLLAKLRAYGFSNNALNLMCSYLKNRKQRRQINNNFSSEKKIIARVPQGSIDGPLLFNLFINDLIFFITTFLSNYADDNSLYNTGKDLELVKSVLVNDFRAVKEWFYENFMILNPNKCHYMCIGKNSESDIFKFENVCLENSKEEVILGITIDNKLTFDSHIKSICRKADQKLSALSRISPYLEIDKKELLFKSMVKSQFNYCPLVWMFCSRNANNLINKIQERSLRLITNDKTSTFEHLLQANNEITTHQRNLQVLMVEVFKIINGFAPPIKEDFFLFRENTYNIRNFQIIYNGSKKTVRYGLETVKYRAQLHWAKLPEKYKTETSLNSFKTKIKT